jgi:peptide/nickel transport system permease protein
MSNAIAVPPQLAEIPAGRGFELARTALRERSVRIGLITVGIVVAAAFAAPLVALLFGHGVTEQFPSIALDPAGVPIGPTVDFWLGADRNGRDVLVRSLYGARTSLLVGIPTTTVAMLIGTSVGVAAGFYGGRTDRILSQLTDVVLSFPFIVISLSLVTLNRTPAGDTIVSPTILVIVVISIFAWTYFARLTRGLVMDIRSHAFVEASITLGVSRSRIIVTDILPCIAPSVIVYWAVQLPQNIIAESTLSFIGVGIQAPQPSLGNIIFDAQSSGLYQVQPLYLITPIVLLVVIVVGFNTVSTGLRNVLDPHGR